MTEPTLALQKLVYARLTSSLGVTMLVDEANIFDRSGRPEAFPCILIGEGHAVFADLIDSFHEEVFLDIHVWAEEIGTTGAKSIAGAIREALRDSPWTVEGHTCHALIVEGAQYLRDPSGKYSHGVITVRAILQEMRAAA